MNCYCGKKLYFYFISVFLVIFLIAFQIIFLNKNNNKTLANRVEKTRKEILVDQSFDNQGWWNDKYSYYSLFDLNNISNSSLKKGYMVNITFNHRDLVEKKKARPDAKDIQVFYLEDEKYFKVPSLKKNVNTEKMEMSFQLQNNIDSKKKDQYYLYYGNFSINDNEIAILEKEETVKFVPDTNYYFQFIEENVPNIEVNLNRQWFLKSNYLDFNLLNYQIKLNSDLENIATFIISDQKDNIIKEGNLNNIKEDIFFTELDTTEFTPGYYTIQSFFKSDDKNYKSIKKGFIVTYPLIANLTVDWEGYDVSDSNLNKMSNFAKDYDNFSFTHFFNPRIYITKDITLNRAIFLDNWVKNRIIKNYDEVAMHLHMHRDSLENAGITPKETGGSGIYWGNYGNDGYDFPASIYSQEDTKKYLLWGKNVLKTNGFSPKGFRFGMFNASLSNLIGVKEAGFEWDSSGRDNINVNGKPTEWNLSTTSSPYLISQNDQNKEDLNNNIGLWQLPDNCGSPISIANPNNTFFKCFSENYNYQLLDKPHILTYITHAQSFNQDFNVLKTLFSELEHHSANKDLGPLLYLTSTKALREYQEYSENINNL